MVKLCNAPRERDHFWNQFSGESSTHPPTPGGSSEAEDGDHPPTPRGLNFRPKVYINKKNVLIYFAVVPDHRLCRPQDPDRSRRSGAHF